MDCPRQSKFVPGARTTHSRIQSLIALAIRRRWMRAFCGLGNAHQQRQNTLIQLRLANKFASLHILLPHGRREIQAQDPVRQTQPLLFRGGDSRGGGDAPASLALANKDGAAGGHFDKSDSASPRETTPTPPLKRRGLSQLIQTASWLTRTFTSDVQLPTYPRFGPCPALACRRLSR